MIPPIPVMTLPGYLENTRVARITDDKDLYYNRDEEDAEVKRAQEEKVKRAQEEKDFQEGLELLEYCKQVKHNQGINLLLYLKNSPLQ